MYEKIFLSFLNAGNDNAAPTRRRFTRRAHDICVLSIGDNTYPIYDWSQCGVLFEADGRKFKPGSNQEAVIRFRLNSVVTDIPVTATVIRTCKNKVACEFRDVPKTVESAFDKIIEETYLSSLSTDFA